MLRVITRRATASRIHPLCLPNTRCLHLAAKRGGEGAVMGKRNSANRIPKNLRALQPLCRTSRGAVQIGVTGARDSFPPAALCTFRRIRSPVAGRVPRNPDPCVPSPTRPEPLPARIPLAPVQGLTGHGWGLSSAASGRPRPRSRCAARGTQRTRQAPGRPGSAASRDARPTRPQGSQCPRGPR